MIEKIFKSFKRYSPFAYEHQEYKKHTTLVECDHTRTWNPKSHINVYIHGYSAIMNESSKQTLVNHINTSSDGKSLLYLWSSGSVAKHFLSKKQVIDVLSSLGSTSMLAVKKTEELFMHFKENQGKAEAIGESIFLQDLFRLLDSKKIEYTHINLIGHSLGARMICASILKNQELATRLKIKDVVFLGGAAPIENDWWNLSQNISGNIYNVYSKIDVALMFKPDAEKCLGRYEIKDTSLSDRIINIPVRYHHWDYWNHLKDLKIHMPNIF